MPRKVFISFLGTGRYICTKYVIDGQVSAPVRFVQEALFDHYCTDWSEQDRIFVFYTEKSKKMNWEDNGQPYAKTEDEQIGLASVLKNKPYASIVSDYTIPEGFSEEEIWEIFSIVYQKLEEDDLIHFDVTHAFRSIPLFSTILFSFSQFMLGTSVEQILYGAFEKLGSARDVEKIPIEERLAPVLTLNSIIHLQQYTEMANEFVTFGRVGKISSTLLHSFGETNNVVELSNAIQMLDNYIATSRMDEIESGKCIIKIRNYIKAIWKEKLPLPTKAVLKKLECELQDFTAGKSTDNIQAAVKWAFRYNMLPQAYTLGQEYIISLCCILLSEYNDFKNKKDFRMFVGSALQISQQDIEAGVFRSYLAGKEPQTIAINNLPWVKQMKSPFRKFSEYRNSINHAKGKNTYEEFQDVFQNLYFECLNLLQNVNQPH